MPLKENGQLAQGQKCRVHIKCMEESTKKDDCVKKFKVLNNFFNTLQLSILYRNVNRKALKRLLFFDSVVFQQHILIISPQALHPGRLKSGINFALEPQWTYIWMGLYPDGSLFGILRHHIFVKSYVHFCISCYSLQTCRTTVQISIHIKNVKKIQITWELPKIAKRFTKTSQHTSRLHPIQTTSVCKIAQRVSVLFF